MNQTLYIVKLAPIGGREGSKWTRLSEVTKWHYVSGLEEEAGEITVFEHSKLRSDAITFSRLRAEDICKAVKGNKFYPVAEAQSVEQAEVTAIVPPQPIYKPAQPLPAITEAMVRVAAPIAPVSNLLPAAYRSTDVRHRSITVQRTIEPPTPEVGPLVSRHLTESPRTKAIRSHFVRVTMLQKVGCRKRLTFFLYVTAATRRLLSGVQVDRQGNAIDGTPVTISLNKSVKATALGTSCEGKLVPLREACKCNSSQAHVHDVAQRPTILPVPAVVLKGSVNNFAALRQIWGTR
jgi:hypothetical protein